MRLVLILAVLIIFTLPADSQAQEQTSLELQIRMTTMRRSGPPQLFYRTVLFTYQRRDFARYVGAAFDIEDYQKIHVFKQNEHGVFLLPYTPPRDVESIRYRLVVDGLWMPDPKNPDVVVDERGNKLSSLKLELPPVRALKSPTLGKNGEIEFAIRHKAGSRIYLTGDFTNWEPFTIKLIERADGIYSAGVSLSPGRYEYCFIVDGLRILDPLNSSYGADSHGYLASRFIVYP